MESIMEAMKPQPPNAAIKGVRFMARECFGEEYIRSHSFLGENLNGMPGLSPTQQAQMKTITGSYIYHD